MEALEWLSERSKEWWAKFVGVRVHSPGRNESFWVALEALDRADKCREVIDRDGLTVVSKRVRMPHNHPLLKQELDSRRLFHKIIHNVSLDWDFREDGL